MPRSHLRLRAHVTVLALYSLLTVCLTWPLIIHLTTHVPGVPQWAFDESTFMWNIWYLKHTLVDHFSNPLHSELIWYPLGIDLILYTYNFFHALLAQPLMLAVDLPFGSNVALLLSTILSGYGTFLLVAYLLSKQDAQRSVTDLFPVQLAAFGAGLLYAFASNRAVYATLGHYDMVTTEWIPFYALMLLRSLDSQRSPRRRRQAAALAGLFLAFNGLAEMITALFLGIFTLIVIAITLFRGQVILQREAVKRDQIDIGSVGSSLAITGIVTFIVWSPVLVPILLQFLTSDFSLRGWGEAIPLSTDLLGWFTPTVLHPIFGGNLVAELHRVQLRALDPNGTGFRDVNTVFLGWCSAALALLGALIYRRRVSLWIWTTVIFGIFTLGPFLQINGQYRYNLDGIEATFPLPFVLLHYLPIIKANRAPNRNSVILMLGIAVLAGFALDWVLERRRAQARTCVDAANPAARVARSVWPRRPRTWIVGILCGLVIFEHLAVPLPLSDARVPTVYSEIAADPRPVSVMHVPLGWRNSFGVFGPERTQLQYYQTVHGKPMLGGNISRAPDFKMDYFTRIPFFQALRDIQFGETVPTETLAAAQAQAKDLIYLYNTGYVLLMPPIPQRFPYADHWQAAWDFAKQTLPLEPAPFWSSDGIEAYRVVQPAGEDHFTLDLGTTGAFPYQGEGWEPAETDQPYGAAATWATDQTSRLFLPLRLVNRAATYQIVLRVHPFAYPGGPPQTVALTTNDAPSTRQTLADGWQTISWTLSGSTLIDGLNRLELSWGHMAKPRDVLGGNRLIGATGVELPIDADLKAFADGGYIALFDEQGVQIDASAGRRGVNVTILDPKSGAVVDKAGFDTTANQYESEALAHYLAQIKPGRPVLIVSYGDATAHLTTAAVDGLRHLGADVSSATLRGNYFAIIGVQGTQPGNASVSIDSKQAFLRLSLNRDRRSLTAAVDWVKIEKK